MIRDAESCRDVDDAREDMPRCHLGEARVRWDLTWVRGHR